MAISSTWRPIMSEYDPLKAGSIDGTDTIPHDRSIVRALNSTYQPNKNIITDAKYTIFVGRLNFNTTESELKETFSKYGEIKTCRLVRDIITGFSKCYGFIEYWKMSSVNRAVSRGDGMILNDNKIFVDFECERRMPGWIPRRLGGGIGGRKESGQLRFGGKSRPFKRPIFLDEKSRGEKKKESFLKEEPSYKKRSNVTTEDQNHRHDHHHHRHEHRHRHHGKHHSRSSSTQKIHDERYQLSRSDDKKRYDMNSTDRTRHYHKHQTDKEHKNNVSDKNDENYPIKTHDDGPSSFKYVRSSTSSHHRHYKRFPSREKSAEEGELSSSSGERGSSSSPR